MDEVITKEQGKLLGFIRKRVGDEEDARDILQDVLYQFTAGFDDIRSVRSVTAWLFTAAAAGTRSCCRRLCARRFSRPPQR